MDYQQAITEVGFIKKLLDNTGKELGQSGWSFILMGLVMLIQDAYVFFFIAIYPTPAANYDEADCIHRTHHRDNGDFSHHLDLS